jgi:hypothetical protein
MNTNHDVQHNQMQPYLVFELMNLEVRESSSLFKRGQIKNQFQDGSASFALCVCSPKLRNDRGSDDPNDGSGIPVLLVEESAEGTWAFDWRVFGPGVTIRFKERGDLGVERLKLVVGGDEGLDGVEYGPGFFVHRTIGILMGT